MENLRKLAEISRFYGKNKDYVIAGGGNTSYKDENTLWVKASGTTLSSIDEDGFAVLDRSKLREIATKKYSENSDEREIQIKTDLFRSSLYPEKGLRPSVETSLHEMIRYSFVVHTHPTLVNGLMCSENAEKITRELFGDTALYIAYTDPGYILFKKVEKELAAYREIHQSEPAIIFLQNHGVFVSANTTEEIKALYQGILSKIEARVQKPISIEALPMDDKLVRIIPAIRMLLSEDATKVALTRHHTLVQKYYASKELFSKISLPFSPDIIVYCKARALFIENTGEAETILQEFQMKLEQYKKNYGYPPKVIVLKNLGYIAAEDNYQSAEIVLDVFEDLMKISALSDSFGGPHFLNEDQIAFIDNWEVENYRRQVSKGKGISGKTAHKVAIVTGAAQGFGAGIAEDLMSQNTNVVIADLNEPKGTELASALNAKGGKNKAIFIRTDVSDASSVHNLITSTVKAFGGLDLFISNAGILRAGGLDEMLPETFDLMTKINYTAYFLCAKYASEVFKLQAKYKPDYFTDIIQINSKSGLKGSNKNFAYAGGKFGGIGLTQSFALELMPYKIKVNSICPGNFFDGPLWSDPQNGLFVQYLNTGKVPGAKTIADVKNHYEKQVPAGR